MKRRNLLIWKINFSIFFLLIAFLASANTNKTLDIEKYDVRKFNFAELSSSSNSLNLFQPNDELPPAAVAGENVSSIFNSVLENTNFLDQITPDDLKNITLPVGMKFIAGNVTVEWAIVATTFTPDYVMLDMLARFSKPDGKDTNKKIEFLCGAWNVKWYYSTGLMPQDVNFALLQDVVMPMGGKGNITFNGNFDMVKGTADLSKSCYINLNCNGLKDLKGVFRGTVSIQEGQIKNVVPDGDDFKIDETPIEIEFETFASLNDFYFNILPEKPLLLTYGNTDVIFELQNIVCDFSSQQSNSTFLQSDYDIRYKNNEWEGLYIENFTVYLPKSYTNEDGRISLGVKHFIIDQTGITAKAAIANMQNIKGGYHDWPLTVNSIAIELEHSTLKGLGFGGTISTPVNKDQNLIFTASYNAQTWSVTMDATDDIPLSIWDAKILVSTVPTINNEQYKFGAVLKYDEVTNKVSAIFNGAVQFEGGTFNNTIIGIREFTVGYDIDDKKSELSGEFTYQSGSKSSFDAFPLKIGYTGNTTIALQSFENGDHSLTIPIGLDLMPDDKIKAGATLIITSQQVHENNRTKWKLKDVDVGEVAISARMKAFSLNGSVRRYNIKNGSEIKKGFSGSLGMAIYPKPNTPNDSISVQALGDFGRIIHASISDSSYNYWHLDIQAKGLNVNLGGPAVMTGIGGGAAYKMQRVNKQFEPKKNNGLYISCNTLIKLAPTNPESEAGFEIQFNDKWGILYVALFSKINLAPDPTQIPGLDKIMDGYEAIASAASFSEVIGSADALGITDTVAMNRINANLKNKSPNSSVNSKSKVLFDLLLHVNVKDNELYGSAKSYVDIAGIIKGSSGNNSGQNFDGYAGGAYFYLGADGYFVHLGYNHFDYFNSKKRVENYEILSLGLNMGSLLSANASAYFLLGSMMPSTFPTPQQMFGGKVPNSSLTEAFSKIQVVSNASGLSFGAAMNSDVKVDFGMLYAKVGAYVGFNILLQKDANCQCADTTYRGHPEFGINGWYAQGLAYAGMSAEVGLRVKVWKIRKTFTVMSASMSAELLAQLPSPTYFSGTVNGSFSVLNGAVKGRFSMPFTVGDQCNIVAKPNEEDKEIPLISKIESEPGGSISPLDRPKITFNYDFDTPFQMGEDNKGNLPKYKFVCTSLTGSYDNNVGSTPDLILAKLANKNEVEIAFKESGQRWKSSDNGVNITMKFKLMELPVGATVWVDAMNEDSTTMAPLDTTIHYSIGSLPGKLLAGDIQRMYPIMDQKYFFTNQSSEGFIKVGSMGYLFTRSDKIYEVIFLNESDNVAMTPIRANNSNVSNTTGKLTFEIPDLLPQRNYMVTIVAKESEGSEPKTGVELFSYRFSTSKHATFAEKVENMGSLVAMQGSSEDRIGSTFEYDEPFDEVELYGSRYYLDDNGVQKPLVEVVPDLTNSSTNDCSGYYSNLLDMASDTVVIENIDNNYYENFISDEIIKERFIKNINKGGFNVIYDDWSEMEKKMIQNSYFPFFLNKNVFASLINKAGFNFSIYEPRYLGVGANYSEYFSKYKNDEGRLVLPLIPNECDLPIRLNYAIGSDSEKNTGTKTLKYFNQSL